jgi:hypothetical protein
MKVSKVPSARSDGRKQLVLLLPPKLIQELKLYALDHGCHVYEVAEKALAGFLDVNKK